MFLTPMPLDGEGVVGNAYLWERRLLDIFSLKICNPFAKKLIANYYLILQWYK